MTSQHVQKILTDHRSELTALHIRSLSVFGSVARNETGPNSDVDILVEFNEDAQVGLFHFIAVKQLLESILHCSVDLGTPDSLREPIREHVLKEAIRVA